MTQEENKQYAALLNHYQVRLKKILNELETLHAEMEPYMQDMQSTCQACTELDERHTDEKITTTCK